MSVELGVLSEELSFFTSGSRLKESSKIRLSTRELPCFSLQKRRRCDRIQDSYLSVAPTALKKGYS